MNHEEQRDVGPATLRLSDMPDDSIHYLEDDDEFEGPRKRERMHRNDSIAAVNR